MALFAAASAAAAASCFAVALAAASFTVAFVAACWLNQRDFALSNLFCVFAAASSLGCQTVLFVFGSLCFATFQSSLGFVNDWLLDPSACPCVSLPLALECWWILSGLHRNSLLKAFLLV